ncbi:leucine rich repeat protein-like protein [Aulographum hederae CBS 113979]|uniref:Leucine rich repeat protein-like protein n=1 Tax=Aulographum hederae CBS 113979 TaxID=1176131 RepID=A0A6G1GK01_9PEZI|nr:leucine rich repeat protein-like protein [Aulographum hederae CBS 113979]
MQDTEEAYPRSKNVIHHGEVQTGSSVFRKKMEYVVLTSTHLVRFKSQQKAYEAYPVVGLPTGRPTIKRHNQSGSVGSITEFTSPLYEAEDRLGLYLPLRHVVSVYQVDDGRPVFALQLDCLNEENNVASSLLLQFAGPEERDGWLYAIRYSAHECTLQDAEPVSQFNTSFVARAVERENDYNPEMFTIYKIVQRPSPKTVERASSEDLSKIGSTVCFLVIGPARIHLVPLSNKNSSHSSSSLNGYSHQESHGILALAGMRLSTSDDTFELTFRTPFQKPKTWYLASVSSYDFARQFRFAEGFLRPSWQLRPYQWFVPKAFDFDESAINHDGHGDSFDRTLAAYCSAYGVNVRHIQYEIQTSHDDTLSFELLKPADPRREQYHKLELLAVLRSLRYNRDFTAMSFAHVRLDELNDSRDPYGSEHVFSTTYAGFPLSSSVSDLSAARMLVQEVRALVLTNPVLRKLTFTSCITRKPPDVFDPRTHMDTGCGIVEAIYLLVQNSTFYVDWLGLSGIRLGETDLGYLIEMAAHPDCPLRGLELSKCGLTDRDIMQILGALKSSHHRNMELLDFSGNPFQLDPDTFGGQVEAFEQIKDVNLSNLSVDRSSPQPILASEILLNWPLEHLRFNGTTLNKATVDTLSKYLSDERSSSLTSLSFDNSSLTGTDIAQLIMSMSSHVAKGSSRTLHLDISRNRLEVGFDDVVGLIRDHLTPSHITLKFLEIQDEQHFRRLVSAFSENTSTTHLDLSKSSLPGEASESTFDALERLLVQNTTLQTLDISGEDSKLESLQLGPGLHRALLGLKKNTSLRSLFVRHQKLGHQGADALAEALRSNSTLEELHCGQNEIPLSSFTNLVDAIEGNTTLLSFPTMDESRDETIKQTVKGATHVHENTPPRHHHDTMSSIRRKFTKKSTTRPHHTPSSSVELSEQDVKAAVSLLNQGWDYQVARLEQYLQRNYCLAHNIPLVTETPPELLDPPNLGGSMTELFERVKLDSTPTMEKDVQLGNAAAGAAAVVKSPAVFDVMQGGDAPPSPASSREGGTTESLLELAHAVQWNETDGAKDGMEVEKRDSKDGID